MTFKTTFLLLLTSVSAFSVAAQEPPVEMQKPVIMEKPPGDQNLPTFVDEPAEFPGGIPALRKYLADNLVYPQSAKDAGIEGKCILQFVVDTNGTLNNIKVVRGVPDCKECDAEAVRLVKGMPKWKPGKIQGKEVASRFNLPISFKLNTPLADVKPIDKPADHGHTVIDEPMEKPAVITSEKPIEPEIYTVTDEAPEFPGGTEALTKFLAANIVYPADALSKKIEGECYVQFIVSAQGKVSNVMVLKGVPGCPECDKEAVRVAKMMPNWKPGKVGNNPVNSMFKFPVTFKLQ